jgi:hypothetical protein
MGYEVFASKSVQQIQRHIRATAAHSELVVLLPHARTRMQLRKVTVNEVFEVLRRGVIHRTPEPNVAKGSLECRMEMFVAGRNCAVVVALADENPNLLVVTVWV